MTEKELKLKLLEANCKIAALNSTVQRLSKVIANLYSIILNNQNGDEILRNIESDNEIDFGIHSVDVDDDEEDFDEEE